MSPKIIVGLMGSSVSSGSTLLSTPAQLTSFLTVLKSHNIHELDTARVYANGRSEELLAQTTANADFLISTKAPGFTPQSLSHANILLNSAKSHAALNQAKVDIYYIHGPDSATPLSEQCHAFGELYNAGRFARFGVCNLSAAAVQEIHNICVREGYPLPSVYQGAYNPLHRSAEHELIPLLRRLNIAFYAWGPLAGGLLAKPIDELLKPKQGTRYHEMPVFGNMYLKESNIVALKKMDETCGGAGMSMMEATMRWFMHHSPLESRDGVILGASSKEQIEGTLNACEKGPLPEEVIEGWEQLWKNVVESGTALPASF